MTTLTKVKSLHPIDADLQTLPRGTCPSAHDIIVGSGSVSCSGGVALVPSGPWRTKILGLNTVTLLSYIPG
jgi:hypothetical protein